MVPTASDRMDGKHPITPLAGPYGHPFHPILVTIPIGAWVMAFVFDLAGIWASQPNVFIRGAYWLVGAGVVAALLAAIFGVLDLLSIPRHTRAFAVGLTHLGLNLVVVALFAISFFVRRPDIGLDTISRAGFILTIVGLVILGVSGYLGGMMSYRYGVRVALEADQAAGMHPVERAPAAERPPAVGLRPPGAAST